MSINAALGKFRRATRDLRSRWSDASQVWRDDNHHRFEAEFIDPVLARTRGAEAVLSTMAEVLDRLRRDCADPDQE